MEEKRHEYKFPERMEIPKLKRAVFPHKLCFVDTETKKIAIGGSQIKHVMKIGCSTYWRRNDGRAKEKLEHLDFTEAHLFWKWCTDKINKHETMYLFAHNVTFDFLVLEGFQQLPAIGYTLKSIYYKFTTSVIRFENDSRRLVIIDTMNYFPVTLDKLGASFGISKIDVDFDTVDNETLKQHCRVDVEIIYTAIRNMVDRIDREGIGSFKVTAPSMASAYFRKTFMRAKIVVNHKPEIVDFEKSAFTGGYTAINNLVVGGDPSLYKLDVNSMYPSVMLENKFPTRIIEWASSCSVRMLERFLAGWLVIARVQLYTNEPIYPYRVGETTIYPLGEFTTTLTTPLLRHAVAHGHVMKVEQIAVYEGEPIFEDYVKFMYGRMVDAKIAGDKVNELFYKTLNRTLYGKFGQRMTETKRVGNADHNEFALYDAWDPKDNIHWKELHAGGSVMFIYERGEARYTSFAISAHITDYARLKLFDLMTLAGRRNVFYGDTDSLIVNEQGREGLVDVMNEYGLGALKVEDTAPVFVGFSKKDYIFGTVSKMKGFTPDGKREENNVFREMQSIGMYASMRKNMLGGAFWQTVNKQYRPTINGATIEDDGTLSPLNLPRDGGEVARRIETVPYIKTLVQSKLTSGQRDMLNSFVSFGA